MAQCATRFVAATGVWLPIWQIVRNYLDWLTHWIFQRPYFCDFFGLPLLCSEKRQKIKACFKAFSWSFCLFRHGLPEWIGLSLLEWIGLSLPEWIGLPLHGWIGLSLSKWMGVHPSSALFSTCRANPSLIFRCYFQKNPDTFQKSKCKHKPLFCCSMTILGHSTNPEVGRMDAIPNLKLFIHIHIWCSLWAANVSTKYKSNV